jgi:hypothetical protein
MKKTTRAHVVVKNCGKYSIPNDAYDSVVATKR